MILTGTVRHAHSGEPLSGISVSDGKHFCVTDEHGAFSMERWDGAHVLFVNLLTEGHNDWFFYLEEGRTEYNFSLLPVKAESEFSFFHTSDTEIDGREYADCISFLRRLVRKYKPAFFSHTGDLGRVSVARHYLAMNRETVGCPVRYAIGNHDFVGERYGEETYERLYGPTWYSFDCGDIHFVTLSIGRGDKPSGYRPEDQWLWLAEDLQRNRNGKRVIVLDHDRCSADELGFSVPVGEQRLDLRGQGLLAWVFGHFHVHLLHNENGVFNICTACPDCGGIDSSPAAVRKITLNGTTVSSEMLYDEWNPQTSAPLWSTQLQGRVEFCTPVLQSGDVLVATNDDGYPKSCGVYRIAENGDIRWYFPTENGVKGDLATDGTRVWAQDTAGVLYCLDFTDGRLLWKQKSDLIKVAYTRSGVLLVGDMILAGNAKHPYAYDKNSGERLWDTAFATAENTPARWVVDEKRGRLLVGAHWKALYALDLRDGTIVWENTTLPVWFRTSTPVVLDDRIYAAGLDSVVILDAEDGKILAEKNLGIRMDVSGAPARDGDLLYYPTAKNGVIALERETLAEHARFACGNNVMSSSPYIAGEAQTVEGSPVIDGDALLFTASDGCLYVYHKHTGKLLQNVALGAPSLVSPIVMGDAVMTADYGGTVKKVARQR